MQLLVVGTAFPIYALSFLIPFSQVSEFTIVNIILL